MELNQAFGQALQEVRFAKELTQEDFAEVSSRTYLSTLERGLKSPTLEKIDQLASVLGIHPVTLVLKCYLHKNPAIPLNKLWGEDQLRAVAVCLHKLIVFSCQHLPVFKCHAMKGSISAPI